MKIAFPIKEENGLDSVMDSHFGMAKQFLIIDTATKDFEIKNNQKLAADGSKCKTGVLGKEKSVDAVITQCIGDGSQRNLNSDNIKVYQAQKDTVRENLDLMENGELKLFHIFDICQTHKNKKEGGCGHHH